MGCREAAGGEDRLSCWGEHKRCLQHRTTCSGSGFLPAMQVNTGDMTPLEGKSCHLCTQKTNPRLFSPSGLMSMESLRPPPPALAVTAGQDEAALNLVFLMLPQSPITTRQNLAHTKQPVPLTVAPSSTSRAPRTTAECST